MIAYEAFAGVLDGAGARDLSRARLQPADSRRRKTWGSRSRSHALVGLRDSFVAAPEPRRVIRQRQLGRQAPDVRSRLRPGTDAGNNK
jgi:hypothetical protein